MARKVLLSNSSSVLHELVNTSVAIRVGQILLEGVGEVYGLSKKDSWEHLNEVMEAEALYYDKKNDRKPSSKGIERT